MDAPPGLLDLEAGTAEEHEESAAALAELEAIKEQGMAERAAGKIPKIVLFQGYEPLIFWFFLD